MSSALASIAVLLLVVAAIPLVLWMVKRLSEIPGQNAGPLAVSASLTVGPRERIAVIRIEERWLVVGITAGSINTLAELTEAPTLTGPGKQGFARMLDGIRRKQDASPAAE